MFRYHRFLLLFLYFLAFPVYADPLSATFDALIAESLPQAHVGVWIQDPDSQKVLYESNADRFFSPASGTKLFTAAAALSYLGNDFRYQTALLQGKDAYYLRFSGSPGLKVQDLRKLLLHLKEQGITRIMGNFYLDTTRFQPPFHARGDSYEDLGWYYAAPSSAVMLNGNAVETEFTSAKQLGAPIALKTKSPEKTLTLINQVKTVSREEEKKHCDLNIKILPRNTLRLYGCIAQSEKPALMRLAIPDPVFFATQMIKKILTEYGITLQGSILQAKVPEDAKVISQVSSPPLSKLVSHMLHYSDNLYASSLTKLLGASITGEGTDKQGVFAIRQILGNRMHLDEKQYVLSDGVGTRYNEMTPKLMGTLLLSLYHDQQMYPVIRQALPSMGVSGTLAWRMKKSPLQNHVFAKTGGMHDVSSLSGYLVLPNGKTLLFTIMSNNVMGGVAKAKALEEKILLALFRVG